MTRSGLVCIVLLLPLPTWSAPLPKQTDLERIQRRFGTPADPDNDCQFDLVDGQSLRIHVPGRAHSLHLTPEKPNAPRIVRTVAGDFELQLRVKLGYQQETAADLTDWPAMVGAGLFIQDGMQSLVEIRHLHERLGKFPWRISCEYDLRGPGIDQGGSSPRPVDMKPVYLRISRQGDRIAADWSQDGRRWLPMHPNRLELRLRRELQVGFHVIQNTKQPMVAEFDQFEFRQSAEGIVAGTPNIVPNPVLK